MILDKEKKYPEAGGKKFCSEDCREKFRKKFVSQQSKSGGGSCHLNSNNIWIKFG